MANKLQSSDSSVDAQTDPAHALRARDFEAAVFDLNGVVTRTARATERVVLTHKLRCEVPRTGLARRNKP